MASTTNTFYFGPVMFSEITDLWEVLYPSLVINAIINTIIILYNYR